MLFDDRRGRSLKHSEGIASVTQRMLTPLPEIEVPPPAADETYRAQVMDRSFQFLGLKALLGAADYSKAGERNAHLSAESELEREAARSVLASLTLEHLYEHPLLDDRGQVDDVARVNYDIDRGAFSAIARMTVGDFKDHLLRAPCRNILPLGAALTGPMAAAVAKICDVHELIYLAKKLPRSSRARTTLGLPGTLASRLQPNHPTDDPRSIALLVAWGLSLAAGDALLGLNPAVDTIDNVTAALVHLDKLRRAAGAPTQICVLAHIKTQLAALERGAPVEILFQSLAGTQRTLTEEFDVTVELLDRGYRMMHERGALRNETHQPLYFETGQGSEFTYGKHNGIDMATSEALCYGLARRYDPFMVNNVTGFIGPETHRDNFEMIVSNLQDHFMGKLLGLPMGMAPCYTLHSQISLEGQQMATQMLTAAGANYYMDVALNTDRMLAYFDTSAHDDQTLRETYDRRPAPEYLAWATERGILAEDPVGQITRGPNWGDPRQFCASDQELRSLGEVTPSLYGFETAGPRRTEAVSRQARLAQALGREAILAELDEVALGRVADFRVLATQAKDKQEHLNSPSAGGLLADKDAEQLRPEGNQVQIVVADGLSADAVHAHVPEVMAVLVDGLQAHHVKMGRPMLVRYGRVKLAEAIAQRVQAELVILFIGERPGGDAQASRSLSAYLVHQGERGFEYTVVSNIHAGGLPPLEAGSLIAEKTLQILQFHAAGNRLESLLRATTGG
jgi:ethanolamine ammonia-lyase large subunit